MSRGKSLRDFYGSSTLNDKLIKLNVKIDNVYHDTFRDKSRFFSYRRSQKLGENDYGRCISIISLTKFSQTLSLY